MVKICKPVTILAASSWSCSSFCEFPIPQLSHSSHAYSKSGLMYKRYSLSKLVRLRRYFNLRRMFKCLDTLLLILSTWLFHLASLLNVTPKCLWEVVMDTDFPLKEKSRFSGTLRLEKIMISVLSGLNDISHFLDQISISFKSWAITFFQLLCVLIWITKRSVICK